MCMSLREQNASIEALNSEEEEEEIRRRRRRRRRVCNFADSRRRRESRILRMINDCVLTTPPHAHDDGDVVVGGGGGTDVRCRIQGALGALRFEAERRMELERERAAAREAEVKRLRAVMQSTGVAESMRRQRELQEEMALAYKVGDMEKAERIKERLAPDEEKFDAETGRYRKRQDKR